MHWRKRLIRDVAALLRKDYTDGLIDRTINRNRQRNDSVLLSVLYVFFVDVIERMCFVYVIEILKIAHGKTAPNKTNYPDTKPSTNRTCKPLREIAHLLPAWNQTFKLTTQVLFAPSPHPVDSIAHELI